jgi:hypothetical protein
MIHTRRVKLLFKIDEGQQRGWWVFAGISRWVQFLNQSIPSPGKRKCRNYKPEKKNTPTASCTLSIGSPSWLTCGWAPTDLVAKCLHETCSMGVGCWLCFKQMFHLCVLGKKLWSYWFEWRPVFISNEVYNQLGALVCYKYYFLQTVKLYMLSLKLHNIKLSLNSPCLWTFFSPSQPIILEPQIFYLPKEKISLKLGVKCWQKLHLLHMIFQYICIWL